MRKTIKEVTGGEYIEISGGSITVTAEEDITLRSGGNIIINAGKSVIWSGGEGIKFGDYTPPEEAFTTHPNVGKVEFLDEDNKTLNQDTRDFVYGRKMKIKVYTTDTRPGERMSVELYGKSKSANQSFDLLEIVCRWRFLTINEDKTAETPLFQFNPHWYSDDLEEYDYSEHKTKIKTDDLNEFLALVSLNAQDVYLPPAGQRLRPITYKRNYEELIGLFNTDNSGTKDLVNNYENKFIDSIPAIRNIVDNFSEFMCEDHPNVTLEQIRAKVAAIATELWTEAVWQNRGYILTTQNTDPTKGTENTTETEVQAILDDRPLYWARLVMQVILKRQPIFEQDIDFERSLVKRGTELEKIIQLFEEKSRNYTGVDFSKARRKKVLITGFDPFFLNEFINQVGSNILHFNPSGVVALALAGDNTLGALIQTMIVPVRYTDFDGSQDNNKGHGAGVIEKYIQPLINQVDMIITISRYQPLKYVIDMFATSRRGGITVDNLFYKREQNSQALETPYEWIPTTLPLTFESPGNIELNWNYNHGRNVQKQFPANDEVVRYGPGGDYLSNEIFYRVAKLRIEHRPTLATGHFHIAQIQATGEDLEPGNILSILLKVKGGIQKGIEGL